MVNDLVKIEQQASKPNALEDNEIEEEEEEEEEGDDGNDDDDDDLFVINVRLQSTDQRIFNRGESNHFESIRPPFKDDFSSMTLEGLLGSPGGVFLRKSHLNLLI